MKRLQKKINKREQARLRNVEQTALLANEIAITALENDQVIKRADDNSLNNENKESEDNFLSKHEAKIQDETKSMDNNVDSTTANENKDLPAEAGFTVLGKDIFKKKIKVI